MKLRRSHGLIVLALGSVIAGCVLFSARQTRQRLTAEHARLRQRQVELDAQIIAARASSEQAARSRAELDAREKTLATSATPERETEAKEADDGLLLSAHPALLAKLQQATRLELNQKYGDLFKRLALPPPQREQLLQLLIRDSENQLDLQGAVRAQGLRLGDRTPDRLRQQQLAELHQAQSDLLGPEAAVALREFDRDDQVRSAVDEFAELILFTDSPLTPAQREPLTTALAQACPDDGPATDRIYDKIDWPRALTAAEKILTPAQFTAFTVSARVHGLAQQNMSAVFSAPPRN